MSKNVAVFVDVANIFYAAKAAGVDIDYVTLLKASTAGRDFVRAYAYTGLDPENENQRQFHAFLGRSGYKVVSKDIRKYGDGRIKANLDIELVVDMMRMAQHIDIAVVVSGDGDFAPAIRAVQQQGVRVEVVSFRGNTSSDLIEVADVFTDISQLARVEKGERSGRRVASEDDDLSMTAVPEKETDNGVRRRRGEGRRTDRPERGERAERGDRVDRPAARLPRPVPVAGDVPVTTGGTIIALPGERLSRAAVEDVDVDVDVDMDEFVEAVDLDADAEGSVSVEGVETEGEGEARRRRRRRGGRGRGRGRRGEGEQTGEAAESVGPAVPGEPVIIAPARQPVEVIDPQDLEDEYLDEEVATLPQHSTFGSVWESQIGVASAPVVAAPLDDQDGYDDEPEIPEYLLAERRQQGRNRGGSNQRPGNRGAPGGRNAPSAGYRAAVDRERYGRTGSPSTGGFGSGGGGNTSGGNTSGGNRGDRQPDRNRGGQSGQGGRGQAPARQPRPVSAEPRERFERSERPAASAEPWSEVPADVQEMLRAELARRQPAARPQPASQVAAPASTGPSAGRSRRTPRPVEAAEATPAAEATQAVSPASSEAPAKAAKAPARTRTKAAAAAAPVTVAAAPVAETEAPAKAAKAPARSKAKAVPAADAAETGAPVKAAEAPAKAAKAPARSRAKAVPAADAAETPAAEAAAPKATRRRSTKSTASGTGEG